MEVIFRTIICITVRTDVITTDRHMAKHLSVLNLLGLFVEYAFGRTPIFSKMRQASPTVVISRAYGIAPKPFLVRVQYAPLLFPPIQCLPDDVKTL